MSTFQEILKKEGSQEVLLAQLKVAWDSIADDKKSEMLHANDDKAFRLACEKGHLKLAKWLRGLCQTAEEQSAMLHAEDDSAFGVACEEGHQEIAEWLWGICPQGEQSAMLHARGNTAFCLACGKGHLKLSKWLWAICPEQEQSAMLHAEDDYAFGSSCQEGHQKIAKWLWVICPQGGRSGMLHADNDFAFRLACQNGHHELAKWLWGICPQGEQLAMLHAKDDGAFGWACKYGYLEIAQWLLELCQTPEEKTAMLRAKEDRAFRLVCQTDHLEMTKWLFSLYQNDVDTRLKLFIKSIKKYGMVYVLWPCLNVIEQVQMLNRGLLRAILRKAIANNDAKDFNRVLQLVDDCHDDVKRQYNDRLYHAQFLFIICALLSSFQKEKYLKYIKGYKVYNRQYFREHQMDYLLRSAIKTKDHDKINMVLSALDVEDLLVSASLLEGWLTLAAQEGVIDFVTCYQKALWCAGLYPLLEKGDEHINDGMITIIRTLFETKTRSMTSLISVINQHASDPQYWPSICQQVIIDMIKTKGLNEDTKALLNHCVSMRWPPKVTLREKITMR